MSKTLMLALAAGLTSAALAFAPDPNTPNNQPTPPAPGTPATPAQPAANPAANPGTTATGMTPAEAEKAKAEAEKRAAEYMKQAAEAAAKAQQPAVPRALAIPVPDMPAVEKKELPGGLIIEDMKIGEGAVVKEHGVVVAYYHGTFKSDGSVFDSAFQRGEPVAFPLDSVIPGWQQGVPGMKVGGIRKLTVPYPSLTAKPAVPPKIPAKSDLVFVVQLVDTLKIEDTKVGEGEEVGKNSVCVTTTTVTTPDGKPFEAWPKSDTYIWLPGENMGMQFALPGMKVGGKRKVSVPKQMNTTMSGLPCKFDGAPALVFEVELTAVRNLPTGQ